MNWKRISIIVWLTVGLLLIFSFGWATAQEPDPRQRPQSPQAPNDASNYIPIQGLLTDADGNRLNGEYLLTVRLYNVQIGGVALCESTLTKNVTDGLFSTYFNADDCPIDGRQLFLAIEVESDGEMTPRKYIDNVPIAWTLRPGAVISGTVDGLLTLNTTNTTGGDIDTLTVINHSPSGEAIEVDANYNGVVAFATHGFGIWGDSVNNHGVFGRSQSSNKAGVYARGMNSGPDLILGGNENTTAGDNGILTSDPAYASSDIMIYSNDNIRFDLDQDGDGEDADFEIRDKDDNLIFNIDNSGAVTHGGTGIAAFPRPALESGWQIMSQGEDRTLTHNLGGNVNNYVVDMVCRSVSGGVNINNWSVGGDVNAPDYYGGGWSDLTTTQITIHRLADDTTCENIRIRIWMYP